MLRQREQFQKVLNTTNAAVHSFESSSAGAVLPQDHFIYPGSIPHSL